LGNLGNTRDEKVKILTGLTPKGVAVLNGDDSNVRWMATQTQARIITFGTEEMNEVRASDITLDWPKGTRFRVHVNGETRNMTIKLLGHHMVYPVLAAIAVALAEGFTLDHIIPSLESLSPTPGRLELIGLPNGAFILRDDFKSSLETVDAAFEVLSEIPAMRRIVVLGEISEPPGSQGPIYRDFGERIAKMASRAIIIGGNFQRYAAGARRGGLPSSSLVNIGRSVRKAVEVLQEDLGPGDVVLIKGRDTQRLDRITLSLMGRTVRCNLSFCNTRVARCEHCPMLEIGWKGRNE
jgi:UDP-N-acetylmuramoyl-tripeptide--D-alanyl-D-alanine ligase